VRHGRYGGQTLTVRAGAEACSRPAANATGEMSDDDQDRYRRGAGPHRPVAGPVVPETSLPEFLLATATQQAERAAIIDASSGRTLSYAELADGVRRVASGLATLGLRPGNVFAIMAPNSPEWLLAPHPARRSAGS